MSEVPLISIASSLRGKIPQLNVSEPDVAAVVLEQKVAFHPFAETLHTLELTLRNGRFDCRTAALVLQHFDVIEPVLDVVTADENTRVVHFADRPRWWSCGRLKHIVERGRDMLA